ncbi:aminoglycoside phosphotransferase (APT) family kinase protein [Streptosporangium becharense]|uniref:Aminoglycoside phosphotransferase (APT) family kinase protein n=1 Tax=Streptosporangium becharense TaxID=1816182 RepID=A0A7W9MIU6_9ACTN|nr:aminoglycoside phosphotransferase family protein [Streptosporangium becharense]MBB2911123.1 aminoglycoside phosphotransferase (APT) family kinase protein [Streptosporangium becharense]MBB5821819.1 aminoglycoside phosphotransferase (APT) family kinase protein [Streptosporangium becharense]
MGALAEEAFTVLREVCEGLGIDHRDAELLRVRSNAVFKLRSEIVVRIATAPNALTRLPLVLAVARWLAEQGFPAVRPADEISDQPVVHEGRVVTFWHYVPSSGRPTTTELGRILRSLHLLPVPPVALKRFADPLAEVRRAVERSEELTPCQRAWLRDRIEELTDRWSGLVVDRSPVLLHGDAWIDNLLRCADGHVVLCDWDGVAVGPREWDLVHTYHGQRRFGLTAADVDAFADAYGSDLRSWAGYSTLMEIRDVYAVGIHIRNAGADPFSRRELPRRLDSLTRGEESARWYMAEPVSVSR